MKDITMPEANVPELVCIRLDPNDSEPFVLLSKKLLAPNTFELEFKAPLIARSKKPGQFTIFLAHEQAERVPISIKDANPKDGTLTVIIQAVGKSSREITSLEPGQKVHSILGPLGQPTHIIPGAGTAVCIGGGYGSGVILSLLKANKDAGNRSVGIIGARCQDLLLCVDEAKKVADELLITTDDGSFGTKGFVTTELQKLLDRGEKIGWVFAVGPIPMMRAVAKLTKPLGIPTYASLNALMLDATGMCGICRVLVGGESKFACFHGPDFDAQLIDWENLAQRTEWYKPQEQEIDRLYQEGKLQPLGDACPALKTPRVEDLDRLYPAELPEGITRDMLDETLKAALRMKIPRQQFAEQDPDERINNFDEVVLGHSSDQAIVDAHRCLQCKNPPCVDGCPVGIDIPAFIKLIREGQFIEANRKILEKNTFGAVCGRVCPQDEQCEQVCVIAKKTDPVAIGKLERFASDYARMHEELYVPKPAKRTGKKVAIIGSGPAGLTCAGELIQKGHDVTIFEALHKVGGVMIYGIPEFRLPNEIVAAEVGKLEKMGVKIITNALIGQAYTIDELMEKEGFDSIFIGTGAGLPWMLDIPGENLKGVYTANEFLVRVNLMRADLFPQYTTPVTVGDDAAIIGCGNTAMDAARTCKRLGKNSTIVYRRTRAEAPARTEEMIHAKEEGVDFHWLTAPTELVDDGNGWVKSMKCHKMELGEPDKSGRRRPVKIEGSEFELPCNTVIMALGFGVNPLLASTTPALTVNKWGVYTVERQTGRTSKKGVFAGGDAITGGATVILAMGQAKIAAAAMHEYLTSGEWPTFCPDLNLPE
jgi:glutamate synthase (NADPH) small chain